MKLITFDESKKIVCFEEPILQVNSQEKVLNFTLRDKDPEETITASLDNIFIQKSYILCSMDQDSNNAMIVVFMTQENCDMIYNAINEVKALQPQSDAIDENKIFEENFYIPLIKAVQQSEDGFQDMKDIILEFVNSLESDERTYYFNIMVDIVFVPCCTKDLQRHLRSNSETLSTSDSGINDSTSPRYYTRKRSFNNISHGEDEVDEIDDDESDDDESYVESDDDEETCIDEPTPENSSNDIIFDFVEFLRHGKPRKKLLIFASPERTHCYEFVSYRTSTKYRCLKCLAQEKDTVICAKIHFDGSKTYDFNIDEEHVCEPIEYLPENYQTSLIIKSPNFKFEKRLVRGKFHPLLIIFDSGDRNMGYKFGFDYSNKAFYCIDCRRFHNISITARYIQHNEENAIEFNRLDHLCQPKEYTP
uniref:Uncharacterized protein n=1 Tax=Panagrolaimus sp. PS1159 TaxID=55785 RepID=A0AC35FIR4_9BILA